MAFNLTVFIVGVFGGVAAEILKWFQLRESPNMPKYAKKFRYWFLTLLMAGIGGALAWLHGVEPTKLLLAFQIGLSAPLILKQLAATVTAKSAKKALLAPEESVLNFIAGR